MNIVSKQETSKARSGKAASRKHQLNLNMPFPSHKVFLNVSANKVQLISLICEALTDYVKVNPAANKLVVTGNEPIPFELVYGKSTLCEHMWITHEEADVIIIHQMLCLVASGKQNIIVICDDTDFFLPRLVPRHSVLLLILVPL